MKNKANKLTLSVAAMAVTFLCARPDAAWAQGCISQLCAPGTPNPALLVDTNGNVGIGTTSPSHRLTVQAAIGEHAIVWGNTAGFNLGVLGIAGDNNSGQIYLGNNGVANVVLRANGRSWLTGGNVGIGITTPQALLHVAGNGVFAGNVGIGTASPQAALDVVGQIRSTTLLLTSDRNAKTNFLPVDSRAVLQKVARLPLSTWHYTNAPGVRHLGPMAQDFKAAFPELGEDDKHIATVDADGVALASIQALHELVQEKDSQIAALQRQVSALQTELAGVKDSVSDRLAALEKAMPKDVLQAGNAPSPLTPLPSDGRGEPVQASFRPEVVR